MIEIRKVERNCIHNQQCRQRGDNRSVIFDHEIWDDGRLAATFCQFAPRRRDFRLEAPDGYAINKPNTSTQIRSTTSSEFEALYLSARADGQVPTLEQLAARKAAKEGEAAAAKARKQEEDRILQIKEAGPALLQALHDMLESMRLKRVKIPVHIERQAEKAIELATKGQQ